MPRAEKKRRVCRMPKSIHFYAAGAEKEHGITMTVEEYETIRLIDHLAFTQEECAARMQVSRATVQMLYAEARKKLARAGAVSDRGDPSSDRRRRLHFV